MAKRLQTLFRQALAENLEREGKQITRRDAIVLAVIDKAMRGDLPAVNFVRELTEKPRAVQNKPNEQILHVRVVEE